MKNLIHVEIKKLMSSKILWMIPAGALLPPIISALVSLDIEGLDWMTFLTTSTDMFNSLIFLIFASFTSFIWAREYEERMMEITLLYPYPKYKLLLAKICLMAIIITLTVLLFEAGTLIIGNFYIDTTMDKEIIIDFIKILAPLCLMHFLLITFPFFITLLSKSVLTGAVLGVIEVALCYLFKAGAIIQYIPLCLPLVISNNLFGITAITQDSSFLSWGILIFTFIAFLTGGIIFLSRKTEL